MRKQLKPVTECDYWKYPAEGFPQRIVWKVIAGPELTDLQKSDIIFDQRDYDLRDPKVNYELLAKAYRKNL